MWIKWIILDPLAREVAVFVGCLTNWINWINWIVCSICSRRTCRSATATVVVAAATITIITGG